jgi:hypothetical protein
MARYRFNWENLPAGLLRTLKQDLGLDGPPAAALREVYGARPKEVFVADAWPTLLAAWLPRDRTARVAIVEQLRDRGLGAAGGSVKTAAQQLDYLRSCRNSTTLRQTVLTELILAGESDLAPVPKSKPPPPHSPDTRVEPDPRDESSADASTLIEFVDQTLMSILDVSELQRDDDGDVPIRSGSSMCYVRVQENDDQPSQVIFICPLVSQITKTPDLLESINEINLQLSLGRFVVAEDRVVLEAELLADALSPVEIQWALDYMTSAADYFDTKLVARFGGVTMLGEEEEQGVDV